uniref:defense against restriction DarA-related protein n=1 Tax=uncultured Cobetia sp. TaxID=410706 RepID=UPI0032B232A3
MTATSPLVLWNDSSAMPVGVTLDQLLYRIRRSDADDGLIFDSVSLDDILEDAEAVFELDALVATQSTLGRKVRSLERVMNAGGGELEVVASQVSSPFKRQGVVNVAAVFELSDGQTVTIMFHNPDAGTAKSLKPTDDLISWKWLLNKKDITIVVAPESGNDLPIRQVARRIKKLAEKNSQAFARMNKKRAERLEYIETLKGEIGELETELDGLTRQIEIARIEAEDEALNTPKPLTKQEGLDLLDELRPWLSRQQYRTMADVIRKGEESEAYIDRAQVLASIIDGMAKTYEQDGKEMDETTAYLHYFRGGGDWYITEKDAKGDGTEQAFGWTDPGLGHGELGYIGVDELTGAGVELDLYFEPKPLSQAVDAQQNGEEGPSAEQDRSAEGLALAEAAATEFGGELSQWEPKPEMLGNWQFANLRIGDAELRIGVSGGGVVQVNGKPHDPQGRVIDNAESLRAAIAAQVPAPSAEEAAEGELPAEPTGKDTPTGVNEAGELEPEGAENVVKTAKGTEVQTGFTVVEAEELIASHDINGDPNPTFPADLQPRDRGRDASIAWVKK